MIDERMPVSVYMKACSKEIDGKAWGIVSIASLVALIDVLAGTQLLPIREKSDFGKAVVLLLFTPLLSFLVIKMLRQLPLASRTFYVWIRAIACVGTFLILNF